MIKLIVEKFPNQEIENHQENLSLFQGAKEVAVESGFFDKDFINGINFILSDIKRDGGHILYKFNPPNDLEIINLEDIEIKNIVDSPKDVRIFSKLALDKIYNKSDNFFEDNDENRRVDSIIAFEVWLKDIDLKTIYSFNAVVIHEVAHAESHRVIPLEGNCFNQKKFINTINQLTKENFISSQLQNINFQKFPFSLREWSEIYALIYQREFVRQENPLNNGKIREWDKHIFNVTNNLESIIEKLNVDKNINAMADLIYQESHTLSYLLSASIEKKFNNFDDRIKFLESFKND